MTAEVTRLVELARRAHDCLLSLGLRHTGKSWLDEFEKVIESFENGEA